MRVVFAIGIYVLLASSVTACASTGPNSGSHDAFAQAIPEASIELDTASQWSTFRNEQFKYRIEVPTGWQINDSAKNEVVIFIDRSNGLAGLHILALDWLGTPDAFLQQNYDFHQRRAKVFFEPGPQRQVRLKSGLQAHKVEFRVQNHTRFCIEHLVDVLVVGSERGYVLQGSVCEEAKHTYGAIIESMQRSFVLEADRDTAFYPFGSFSYRYSFSSSSGLTSP